MHTVESTPGARQLGPSARSRPQEEAPWGNGRPHPASCGGDSGRGPRGRFPAWRRFDVLRAALPAGLLRPCNPFWGQLSLWPPACAHTWRLHYQQQQLQQPQKWQRPEWVCTHGPPARLPGDPERSGAPAAWWRQTGLVRSPSRGHSDSGGAGRGAERGAPGSSLGRAARANQSRAATAEGDHVAFSALACPVCVAPVAISPGSL